MKNTSYMLMTSYEILETLKSLDNYDYIQLVNTT